MTIVSDGLRARLQRARELGGLSRRRLSVLSDLSQAQVGMIERGEVERPAGDTLRKLARTLGVSTDWLLDGGGDEPTDEAIKAAVAAAESTAGDMAAEHATGTEG